MPIHPIALPLPPACPNPSFLVRKGLLAQGEHPRKGQPGREGLTITETLLRKRGALLKVNPSAIVCRH